MKEHEVSGAGSLVLRRILIVTCFAIGFGYVEAAVVVSLRDLYYPGGFGFPLRDIPFTRAMVEIGREAATMIMLWSVAVLAGRMRWERFGYFLVAFGAWDVFYYIWLAVVLGWPGSLWDWDILFLIPVPWIAPVLAPVLISILMISAGITIVIRLSRSHVVHPRWNAWLSALSGTTLILYSFMSDIPAVSGQAAPTIYHYELLAGGLLLLMAAVLLSFRFPPHRA